jgi:hypothetical protein
MVNCYVFIVLERRIFNISLYNKTFLIFDRLPGYTNFNFSIVTKLGKRVYLLYNIALKIYFEEPHE